MDQEIQVNWHELYGKHNINTATVEGHFFKELSSVVSYLTKWTQWKYFIE